MAKPLDPKDICAAINNSPDSFPGWSARMIGDDKELTPENTQKLADLIEDWMKNHPPVLIAGVVVGKRTADV